MLHCACLDRKNRVSVEAHAGFGMGMRTPLLERWNAGLVSAAGTPRSGFPLRQTCLMGVTLARDLLTAVGVVGAVVVFFGYAFSGSHPALLWIATLGLVINWFGDLLDGTLARFEKSSGRATAIISTMRSIACWRCRSPSQ